MKFICEKENLLLGLNAVSRTSVGRTPTPILEGILLTLKNSELIMTTNDLEIGMEYIIDNCDAIEEGRTVVDCKMFGEIIRKLPNSSITIYVNDKKLLVIECEGSIYKLSTMDAEEFPILPTVTIEKKIYISQRMLKDMIKKTIFAVSAEENRPIFTGCLFEIKNNEMFVVAVVPGKYLNEIIKNLQDNDENIEIGIAKNQALFELKNCKIVTRLLEGEFLNYNNVIPSDKETRIKVSKAALQGAVERASIFSMSAAEKEKKYPIKMFVSLGSIIISCTSQVGDAKEEVIVETEGKELEIGFNPKYLLDALKVIEDDEVYMDFGTNLSPCVIRPVGEEKYTYMVLPVRLKE